MSHYSKKYLLEEHLNIDKVVASINRVSESTRKANAVHVKRIELSGRQKKQVHKQIGSEPPSAGGKNTRRS